MKLTRNLSWGAPGPLLDEHVVDLRSSIEVHSKETIQKLRISHFCVPQIHQKVWKMNKNDDKMFNWKICKRFRTRSWPIIDKHIRLLTCLHRRHILSKVLLWYKISWTIYWKGLVHVLEGRNQLEQEGKEEMEEYW